MKSAPKLAKVITELLATHNLPLDQMGYLRVQPDGAGLMPLTVSIDYDGDVWVYHHYEQMGDLMYDPLVACWVSPAGVWYPYHYEQSGMGVGSYVEFEDGQPRRLYRTAQADLAVFCETIWADNLRAMWLDAPLVQRVPDTDDGGFIIVIDDDM